MQLLPAFTGVPETNKVYNLDIFDLCAAMPSNSVDMILCDLPYGTTACSWDTVIPFEPMWSEFKRILRDDGIIALTASQPFTSILITSNLRMFKYEWIWEKTRPSGHLNAQIMPMKTHENILIFANQNTKYNPVMLKRDEKYKINKSHKHYDGDTTYGNYLARGGEYDEYFPRSIITFQNTDQTEKQHPTQKPVDLFSYLIRTYTQPGELVFDPCVGSGTTAYAARAEGRNYIVGDSSAEYVEVARKRLDAPYTPMFAEMLTA